MTTIYIAGPMTGIENFNFPAFNKAAKFLRSKGFGVVNPAEIAPVTGMSWRWYMQQDIPQLVKCDAIYLLPGWRQSKGATLEHHIAQELGMTIIYEGMTG